MSLLLGTLNINDGTKYFVGNEGVNLGQPQTTWDEAVNYAGAANVQVNVHPKQALIPVVIPMRVHGTSISDLNTNLAALWTEVDKATNTLTWDSESYDIVYSTRPAEIVRDPQYQLGFNARFTLVLTRKP